VTRSDLELVRAHLAGEQGAFRDLATRYEPLLWPIAVGRLRDQRDAAEAVQDALVRAYTCADQYRGDASVRTWLTRILINACLDRHRHNRSRPAEPMPAEVLELVPAPRDPIADRETSLDVTRALRRLPDEQRVVIELVELHGYQLSEVAGLLGVAVGTVKSRRARARLRLQALLDPTPPLEPAVGGLSTSEEQ
jgi:RNA polymerase sigma-70 factor (ECF subfamily)